VMLAMVALGLQREADRFGNGRFVVDEQDLQRWLTQWTPATAYAVKILPAGDARRCCREVVNRM
jgi:hypothetical protein